MAKDVLAEPVASFEARNSPPLASESDSPRTVSTQRSPESPTPAQGYQLLLPSSRYTELKAGAWGLGEGDKDERLRKLAESFQIFNHNKSLLCNKKKRP